MSWYGFENKTLDELLRSKPRVTPDNDRIAALEAADAAKAAADGWLAKVEALRKEGMALFPASYDETRTDARRRKAETLNSILDRARNVTSRKFSITTNYQNENNALREWTQEVERRQQEAEQAQKLAAMRDRAIQWLIARGMGYGVDFTADTAIRKANSLAFDAEVSRLKESSVFHPFAGDDSCENCAGWDGESRRCDCGNRRVSWVTYDSHSFESPSVHAEAY